MVFDSWVHCTGHTVVWNWFLENGFFFPESSRNVCAKLNHFLLIVLCSFKKEITVGTLITLICYHYACGSTQQSPSLFLNPLCQCTMWYMTLQTWFLQSIWYHAKSYQLSLIGFFYLSIYSLLLTQLQNFIKLVGSNLPSWCPVGLFLLYFHSHDALHILLLYPLSCDRHISFSIFLLSVLLSFAHAVYLCPRKRDRIFFLFFLFHACRSEMRHGWVVWKTQCLGNIYLFIWCCSVPNNSVWLTF